jgi:hypothetical protein
MHAPNPGHVTGQSHVAVDWAHWPSTLVSEVMLPLTQLRMVTTETPVTEAHEAGWIA